MFLKSTFRLQPYLKKYWSFLISDTGGLKQKIFRAGIWLSVLTIITYLIQLAKGIILARLLLPEVFGTMAICLAVIRGMELFSETGVKPALIHRQNSFEEARDTAFCIMIIRGVLLSIITFMIAPWIGWYYENNDLVYITRTLALSFLIAGFANINMIALEKNLNFKKVAIAEQLVIIGNFAVVVLIAYYLRSIWALAIGHILGAFFTLIISYMVVPVRPQIKFNPQIGKELLGYGRFITGLTIVLYFTTELDNFVAGKILGMEALGYYLIAYTLANMTTANVSKILSRVMFPAYSILQTTKRPLNQPIFGCSR
jgi:PST family polysaccharide transporter/lipopolysaccharide exporter